MTTTEAKNCQTCGHSPAAWAEGGLILIQCIQPTCASIAIIGGHTLEMATKAWDAYQATNKDRRELRETNRALLNHLDEANAEIRRLTAALAASNADRDRLAQQLGMAQTEARGLRVELQRLSAPNGGVA